MQKKGLFLFLVLVLCLGLCSTTVLAAEGTLDLSRYDHVGATSANGWTLVGIDDEALPHFGGPAGSHEGIGMRFGFLDAEGREIVAPKYRWIEAFVEGLAMVWGDEGYGFIDQTGQEVVPARYCYAKDFSEGLAAVQDQAQKWGYVDQEGKLTIPIRYDTADSFSEGLAAVGIFDSDGDYKRGYIDKEGTLVIPFQYNDSGRFSEGLAPVKKQTGGEYDHFWGYIDREGNEVIPCQFDNVYGFRNGVAQVLDPGWLDNWHGYEPWRYIDKNGRDMTAYPSTQTVLVDGEPVEFFAYALKDENGFDTNFVKLRDVAQVLSGTTAQFEVGWDGSITITTDSVYTSNGSEMVQNFFGNQLYTVNASPVKVNGGNVKLEAITLTDAQGGGFTYFKLRDLGSALGFTVDWTVEKGIFLETD